MANDGNIGHMICTENTRRTCKPIMYFATIGILHARNSAHSFLSSDHKTTDIDCSIVSSFVKQS